MQLLATAEQMQQFDSTAITQYSLSGMVLMENAGRAFVDQLESTHGSLDSKTVIVLCGKGNNGGDGFVIARHLANRGCSVHVALLCKRTDVRGDAKRNLDILLKIIAAKQLRVTFEEILSIRKLAKLQTPHVIVDAIFGTGFSGNVRGIYKQAIEWINSKDAFVGSVDIPSGVNGSTGVIGNVGVRADLTVTFVLAKIGHYVGSGREHSGEVVVADISIPRFLLQGGKKAVYRVEPADVTKVLPRRTLSAHKYSVGKVFVLAGSRFLTGAPYMTAQSAMKAGAGAVILGVPKSIHAPLIRKLTEVMITPLDETTAGTISPSAMEQIRERIEWSDVVALGPGLSRHEETDQLVLELISSISKPMVIDADGLNILSTKPSAVKKRKHATILTPHVGELKRLTGLDSKYIDDQRVEVSTATAQKLRSIVTLKGASTVTGTPEGTAYVNSTGNPGMATAGAGDVLTGIVASFAAQGMLPEEAAYSGVFVHGLAGDIAAKEHGERSLLALDILEHIPDALKLLDSR
ncbi:MAG: NAD(P)H-hydrate dehydratase [Ignavibacteriae bacterium]|nr:NAD(P)H-hydrate dehydratase [Ignavibacteriota bacterium]